MPFAEPEGAVCFELTLTCIMLRMCSCHIYGQAAESVISRNMVHTLDDNSLPGNWREREALVEQLECQNRSFTGIISTFEVTNFATNISIT